MKNNTSNGINFLELLQVCLIVLKLCKIITWSWWLVFLPVWIGIAIFVILFIIMYIKTK